MATNNLMLVTSPPACGKTTLAKRLAHALKETVYLDKDTLIPLSNKIFQVAGEENNRSSAFFETNIRDLEYQVILDLAFEAILYDSHVIINAPFSREIRDKQYILGLRKKLSEVDGELKVIWIDCSPEVAHRRMLTRNSVRDTWKLEHWEEYVKTENFAAPDIDGLLIYQNETDEIAEASFSRLLRQLH